MDTDAAAAAGLDADTMAEIPEELLAEALGVTKVDARAKRRGVILIDGRCCGPTRTMSDGEPSVFDKELGDGDAADAGHAIQLRGAQAQVHQERQAEEARTRAAED